MEEYGSQCALCIMNEKVRKVQFKKLRKERVKLNFLEMLDACSGG